MIRCTANGIHWDGKGGLIYADGWTSISLEQNYLTNITSSSYGAIMRSSSCGTTTILQNCLMRTYTTTNTGGQTFYIEYQTEKIEVEDNTAVQCRPSADTGNFISKFDKPPTLQVMQNNFSFCKVNWNSVFAVRSSGPINISRNTIANDTAAIVYNMYDSQLCTLSCENVVGIDHIQNDYGFFGWPKSGFSITDSLFISVRLARLVYSGSIDIDKCLFFDCSFSYSTDILTVKANTLPFTNTNTHFQLENCFYVILKTNGFTEQSEFSLKTFLTHFIIE